MEYASGQHSCLSYLWLDLLDHHLLQTVLLILSQLVQGDSKSSSFLLPEARERWGRESCCFLKIHRVHDGVRTSLSKNAKWNKLGIFIQKRGHGFSGMKPGMELESGVYHENPCFKMSYFSCTYWAVFQYSDLFIFPGQGINKIINKGTKVCLEACIFLVDNEECQVLLLPSVSLQQSIG